MALGYARAIPLFLFLLGFTLLNKRDFILGIAYAERYHTLGVGDFDVLTSIFAMLFEELG